MSQGGASLVSPAQAQDYSTYRIKKQIEAEVIFGVSSQFCKGHGICKIYTKGTIGLEKGFCHFTEVKIRKDQHERLFFFFQKGSMRNSTVKKYFNSTHFKIEESVRLPYHITSSLNIKRSTIEKGKYSIQEFTDSIRVVF